MKTCGADVIAGIPMGTRSGRWSEEVDAVVLVPSPGTEVGGWPQRTGRRMTSPVHRVVEGWRALSVPAGGCTFDADEGCGTGYGWSVGRAVLAAIHGYERGRRSWWCWSTTRQQMRFGLGRGSWVVPALVRCRRSAGNPEGVRVRGGWTYEPYRKGGGSWYGSGNYPRGTVIVGSPRELAPGEWSPEDEVETRDLIAGGSGAWYKRRVFRGTGLVCVGLWRRPRADAPLEVVATCGRGAYEQLVARTGARGSRGIGNGVRAVLASVGLAGPGRTAPSGAGVGEHQRPRERGEHEEHDDERDAGWAIYGGRVVHAHSMSEERARAQVRAARRPPSSPNLERAPARWPDMLNGIPPEEG